MLLTAGCFQGREGSGDTKQKLCWQLRQASCNRSSNKVCCQHLAAQAPSKMPPALQTCESLLDMLLQQGQEATRWLAILAGVG
jgi:hypothetical protein